MDPQTQLLSAKAWLYTILALLIAILGTISYSLIFASPTPEENKAFCGTESLSTPENQKGKELFAANCASCHNKNMKDKLTGPALAGVESRWSKYPKADLYSFIRHSQGMIQKGHPMAKVLWKEWQPTIMNDFGRLSDEEIAALLAYIER